MRNLRIPAIVTACVLLGLAAAGSIADRESKAATVEQLSVAHGFGVSLSTGRAVYRAGEPILITFEVFNRTQTPVRFDFNTAQHYELLIEDRQGKELWRWSEGRMFATVLGEESVGPDNPVLRYETEFTGAWAPGRYGIRAWLTARGQEVMASIEVEVR